MPQIIYTGQVNVPSLTADDLYVQIIQPPGYVTGVPTDVIGVVGTASWGPVNRAVHMGSSQDALGAFGAISSAALTDPYDLPTDLALAFGQASSQATLEGWAVRVTDGTDTAATVVLNGAASAAPETATISGTIANGDTVSLTATSTAITGSPVTVTYSCTGTDTTTSVAAGLAKLVNANAALVAAGIYANTNGATVNLYWPTGLSPAPTWQESASPSSGGPVVTLSNGTATTTGITLTAIYTGVLGNQVQVSVVAGANTSASSVVVVGPTGLSEIYSNLPNATFWGSLLNAINNGQSGVRGPSAIVRASNANIAVGSPNIQSYTLSGGTDGRTGVTSSTLLGNDSNPGTGLYALRQLQPAIAIAWIAGNTNTAIWASCLAFAQSEGCSFLAPMPSGTSTSAAISAVATNGIHDPSFAYCKDWIYFFDPLNNMTRLVPPTAVIAGTWATYQPQESPGNKTVSLVIGTERANPWTGNQLYTVSEVGQLESAGVMFVGKPIPAGNVFGIRHGMTTSLQPATAPAEYWRLTSYLARSFAQTMGQFVGQLQSTQPNDPLRAAVRNQLNSFCQFLVSPAAGSGSGIGQIDSYQVVCAFAQTGNPGLGINTPDSIAQHYLFALVKVRYLSSVRFFVLSLQGGTTVVTVSAGPGQQLATPLPPAAA